MRHPQFGGCGDWTRANGIAELLSGVSEEYYSPGMVSFCMFGGVIARFPNCWTFRNAVRLHVSVRVVGKFLASTGIRGMMVVRRIALLGFLHSFWPDATNPSF